MPSDGQVLGYQTVFTQGHVTWDKNGLVITQPFQRRFSCP